MYKNTSEDAVINNQVLLQRIPGMYRRLLVWVRQDMTVYNNAMSLAITHCYKAHQECKGA